MTERASSTTAKKKPAKKAAAKKKSTPRASPVVVKKPALREQLHPGLLASALDLADGDTRRIHADSWTSVTITM